MSRSRAFGILGLMLAQLPVSVVCVWAGYRLYHQAIGALVSDRLVVVTSVFIMIGSCLAIAVALLQCVIVVRQRRRLQIVPPAQQPGLLQVMPLGDGCALSPCANSTTLALHQTTCEAATISPR